MATFFRISSGRRTARAGSSTLPDPDALFGGQVERVAGPDIERVVPLVDVPDDAVDPQGHGAVHARQQAEPLEFLGALEPPGLGTPEEHALRPGEAVQQRRRLSVQKQQVRVVGEHRRGEISPVAPGSGLGNNRPMTALTLHGVLGDFPRLRHALTPTPIHYLRSLSKWLGVNVYCKRDDLTGFGFGGNKIRKLEFLVHDALQRGCRTLVTCGSNQSNWCRMTAAVGAANGLAVHLVLGGGRPERATGNLVLNAMLGATCHHLDTHEDGELEAAAAALAEELEADGLRPYRMVMGGSTGLGALGYVDAMQEIMLQEQELGIGFDAILHATG